MARPDLYRCRWRSLRTARRGVLAAGVKPATRLSLSGKDLQGCDGNSATMPHTFCLRRMNELRKLPCVVDPDQALLRTKRTQIAPLALRRSRVSFMRGYAHPAYC